MKKKEIIIICVLTIFFVLYLLLRPEGRVSYDLPGLKAINIEDLSSLEYQNNGQTVTLRKDGDNWTLPDGQNIDNSKMEKILSSLKNLTLLDKLSSTDDYSRYGLDENSSINITYRAGNREQSLRIGKNAPGGGNYISLPGEKGIYSININIRNLIPKTPKDLLSKVIFDFKPDTAKTIVLQSPDRTLNFSKEDENWSHNGKILEFSNPLALMIEEMHPLKCTNFLENPPEGDILLELHVYGEKNSTLYVYNKSDAGYPATSSQSEDSFLLPQYMVESWLKNLNAE